MAFAINPNTLALGFGLGLPAVTYLYLFWVTRPRWIRAAAPPQTGSEPKLPQPVRPALAGLYLDGKVGPPEIAATIVDLLTRGYLGIVEKRDRMIIKKGGVSYEEGERIVFLQQKDLAELPQFERTIGEHLVSRGSIAKTELEIARRINRKLFDEHVSEAIRSLYQEGVAAGVFFEDPNSRYAWYYLTGLLIFFVGVGVLVALLGAIGFSPTLLFYPLGLIFSGSTVISRARFISALSNNGRLVQEVWHDYREELTHWQPQGRPEVYLKYLPYAFALGVEGDWTSRWKEWDFARPDWFVSFGAKTREDFFFALSSIVLPLGRDLFATRDPALKD